MIWSFIQ